MARIAGTHPAGTTGRPTVMFPSEVVTRFFMAKVLWKVGLVTSIRGE